MFPAGLSARLAKALTIMCFRNGEIENIHAGQAPTTKAGDYSDARVVDADGNEFTLNEISRISDAEMMRINKAMVNRLYTFFMQADDPRLDPHMEYLEACAVRWDEPEIVTEFLDARGES